MDTQAKSQIKYKNGNYIVTLNPKTGTKEYLTFRAFEDYDPDFPDSLDVKITGKCCAGCPFCFENSGPEGKHSDLSKLFRVLDKLPNVPIEVAIGGGDVLEVINDNYDGFIGFLKALKGKGFITGVTIKLRQFLEFLENPANVGKIKALFHGTDPLVNNIGLSVPTRAEIGNRNWVDVFSTLYHLGDTINDPNTELNTIFVFHTILGISSAGLIEQITEQWNDYIHKTYGWFGNTSTLQVPRILILGYKSWGRGEKVTPDQEKLEEMRKFLIRMINRSFYSPAPISLDNSAIDQLHLKESMTKERWRKVFMGEETSHSMYVDAVEEIFAPTSHSLPKVPWKDVDDIIDYFNKYKQPHDYSDSPASSFNEEQD